MNRTEASGFLGGAWGNSGQGLLSRRLPRMELRRCPRPYLQGGSFPTVAPMACRGAAPREGDPALSGGDAPVQPGAGPPLVATSPAGPARRGPGSSSARERRGRGPDLLAASGGAGPAVGWAGATLSLGRSGGRGAGAATRGRRQAGERSAGPGVRVRRAGGPRRPAARVCKNPRRPGPAPSPRHPARLTTFLPDLYLAASGARNAEAGWKGPPRKRSPFLSPRSRGREALRLPWVEEPGSARLFESNCRHCFSQSPHVLPCSSDGICDRGSARTWLYLA